MELTQEIWLKMEIKMGVCLLIIGTGPMGTQSLVQIISWEDINRSLKPHLSNKCNSLAMNINSDIVEVQFAVVKVILSTLFNKFYVKQDKMYELFVCS